MHLLYTPHTQLSFRLIVRTLSAPIYLSYSKGVFGHRAIQTKGGIGPGLRGGCLIEQTDMFQNLPPLSPSFPRQTQTTKFPSLPRPGGSH